MDILNPEPLAADVDPAQVFDEIWSIYERNYGAFPAKSVDWGKVRGTYLPQAASVTTRGELYWLVARAVSELGDGHTYAIHPAMLTAPLFASNASSIGACAVPVEGGELVVYSVTASAPAGLVQGDVVEGFDGRSVETSLVDLANQPRPYISASTPAAAAGRLALSLLNRAPTDKTMRVRHLDGTVETLGIKPSAGNGGLIACSGVLGPSFPVKVRGNGVLTADIPIEGAATTAMYIRFPFFGSYNAQGQFVVQPILETLREVFSEIVEQKRAGILLDLRSNGGGSPQVYLSIASYLYDATTPLFQCANRDPLAAGIAFQPGYVLPAEPDPSLQFSGPVAVLVNSQSFSAADFTPYFLQKTGRARTFGEPSGGGFGSGSQYTFQGDPGWGLGVNDIYCQSLEGDPLEGQPLPVDEPVQLTRSDIASKTDTVIERARLWLASQP